MKKRRFVLFLAALLLVLLCACEGESKNIYTATDGERTYTIDLEAQTISYDDVVCQFSLSSGAYPTFCVTYPDGSSWWRKSYETSWSSGWSDDYDENRYVPGELLWSMLGGQSSEQSGGSGGYLLIGLLLVGLGIFYVAAPRASWYLSHGWKFKDVEPSDAALTLRRFGGVAAILIGAIMAAGAFAAG